MPTAKRRRPRIILCAALTADGRLDAETLSVPPVLYEGGADRKRHPWAEWYDSAAGMLVDAEAAKGLRLPQAASRPVLTVRLEKAESWSAAEARAELLGALRKFQENFSGPVLCFGGARLFRALLDTRLVDELCLIVRPKIDGRRGAATLSGESCAFFPASVTCRLVKMETNGDECLLHYRVRRRNRTGEEKR